MDRGVVLTALAVLVGAIASAASTSIAWVRAMYGAAAILSLCALYYQWKGSRPFVFAFTDDGWQPSDHGRIIVVPARQHGKGSRATGRLEERDANGGWETVYGGAVTRENGDVVVSIADHIVMSGRVVVY